MTGLLAYIKVKEKPILRNVPSLLLLPPILLYAVCVCLPIFNPLRSFHVILQLWLPVSIEQLLQGRGGSADNDLDMGVYG